MYILYIYIDTHTIIHIDLTSCPKNMWLGMGLTLSRLELPAATFPSPLELEHAVSRKEFAALVGIPHR